MYLNYVYICPKINIYWQFRTRLFWFQVYFFFIHFSEIRELQCSRGSTLTAAEKPSASSHFFKKINPLQFLSSRCLLLHGSLPPELATALCWLAGSVRPFPSVVSIRGGERIRIRQKIIENMITK